MTSPAAPRVVLVPLDDAEREVFLEAQALEYADQKARAGIWTREESLDRARQEIRDTIARASARDAHRLYKGLDGSGGRIGWIWIGPVPGAAPNPAVRWLFQITVEPSLRGRGYGRALLRAAEDAARATGACELRLNVFAWNRVAISLYRSEGYETVTEEATGFELRKDLA